MIIRLGRWKKNSEERWKKTLYKKREFDKTGGHHLQIKDTEEAKEAYNEFKENYDKHINIIIDEIVDRETNGNQRIETWHNDNETTRESFKRHLLTQDKWNGQIINGGVVNENGYIELDINDNELYGCHGLYLVYDPLHEKVIEYYGLQG